MVLKSPVDPLGPPADGVIPGVARVNGDSAALPGADVGSEHAVADQDVVAARSPRESTHLIIRAGQRLGGLAARRRGPLTAVGTLLAVGVLVFVLAGRWGQFATAAAGAPWWALTAAAALQTASLLARTESWNLCVHAAGGTVGRRLLYRAAGVGYLGNIVNGELGSRCVSRRFGVRHPGRPPTRWRSRPPRYRSC
jgi:hypothetical protein